jgi:hypothetical protein
MTLCPRVGCSCAIEFRDFIKKSLIIVGKLYVGFQYIVKVANDKDNIELIAIHCETLTKGISPFYPA